MFGDEPLFPILNIKHDDMETISPYSDEENDKDEDTIDEDEVG